MKNILKEISKMTMNKLPKIGILAVVCAVVSVSFAVWAQQNTMVTHKQGIINVEVSSSENVESMVGFLHSFDLTAKNQHLITDLSPKLLRTGDGYLPKQTATITHSNDALPAASTKKIITIGSFYGYPSGHKKWQNPKDNLKKLSDVVANVYRRYGNSVIYDVWNEPDISNFWGGSREDFFYIFKIIHDKIRSMPGGSEATISGPSTSKFDMEYFSAFFSFCINNNIKLDVISWHEMKRGNAIFSVSDHIRWVKNNYISKGKMGAKKIYINEMIGKGDQYSPIVALAYFKELEEGGADGACKACWRNSKGILDCNNQSLDGLLDENSNPRSIWWLYKYYAQSTKNRLNSNSSYKELISFAYREDNSITILFGNFQNSKIEDLRININAISGISGFGNNSHIQVSLYEIPNSGEKPLSKPLLKQSKVEQVTNNKVEVNFSNITSKSVYFVSIKSA